MDISLLYITIILLILVVISIFQRLKLVTWILLGSYLIYLIFATITDYQQSIYLSSNTPDSTISIKNEVQLDEKLPIDKILIVGQPIVYLPSSTELKIRKAVITREIQDRVATNVDTIFHSDVEYLYFYTIVNNPSDTATIIHKWLHEDQFISQTEIILGKSIRWRCWSRIAINPDRIGNWEASVFDSTGSFLASTKFSIVN